MNRVFRSIFSDEYYFFVLSLGARNLIPQITITAITPVTRVLIEQSVLCSIVNPFHKYVAQIHANAISTKIQTILSDFSIIVSGRKDKNQNCTLGAVFSASVIVKYDVSLLYPNIPAITFPGNAMIPLLYSLIVALQYLLDDAT